MLAKYGHGTILSFRADIGDNATAYLARLGSQHRTIGRQPQKTRKMNREIGPVRLELDCRDPQVREVAIEWKRQQYRRTHILDLFGPSWTRKLVAALHEGRESDVKTNAPADAMKVRCIWKASSKRASRPLNAIEIRPNSSGRCASPTSKRSEGSFMDLTRCTIPRTGISAHCA